MAKMTVDTGYVCDACKKRVDDIILVEPEFFLCRDCRDSGVVMCPDCGQPEDDACIFGVCSMTEEERQELEDYLRFG